MRSAVAPPSPSPSEPAVPLPRIAGFVRQITHDVRNTLNSLDLQAAYVMEIISDPEAVDEVRRMRTLIHTSARQLQALSANFWTATPSFVPYDAAILIEDLQHRLVKTHPEESSRVQWNVRLGSETLAIDIEMLFGALTRLFENAWTFAEPGGKIGVDVYIEQNRFVFDLRQSSPAPESDPSRWGHEPFVTTRRGAYGLGLFRARSSISLHEGQLEISHDSGRNLLLTRVTLPLAPPHEPDPAASHSRH